MFKVFTDGVQVGSIKNDSSQEYELTPGTHEVQCKLNWMSSPVYMVEVREGANSYVSVSNGMKYYLPLYVMLLIGLFLPFFLKIGRVPIPDFINVLKIVLIVPALIYVVLYMTAFKKKYISITEDKSNPFR